MEDEVNYEDKDMITIDNTVIVCTIHYLFHESSCSDKEIGKWISSTSETSQIIEIDFEGPCKIILSQYF